MTPRWGPEQAWGDGQSSRGSRADVPRGSDPLTFQGPLHTPRPGPDAHMIRAGGSPEAEFLGPEVPRDPSSLEPSKQPPF